MTVICVLGLQKSTMQVREYNYKKDKFYSASFIKFSIKFCIRGKTCSDRAQGMIGHVSETLGDYCTLTEWLIAGPVIYMQLTCICVCYTWIITIYWMILFPCTYIIKLSMCCNNHNAYYPALINIIMLPYDKK